MNDLINDEEKTLYGKVWQRWKDLQFIMLFEEMSELQKEICKQYRGKGDNEAIAEEIADVQIMLDQMKLRYGEERCGRYKKAKLARLAAIVED